MPIRPPRPCNKSGCVELITGKDHLCSIHKKQASINYELTRETATQRGYDTRWRKIRKLKLSRNPMCMCEDCNGTYLVANLVHHRDNNPKNNNRQNLQSMNDVCHNKYHAAKGDRW